MGESRGLLQGGARSTDTPRARQGHSCPREVLGPWSAPSPPGQAVLSSLSLSVPLGLPSSLCSSTSLHLCSLSLSCTHTHTHTHVHAVVIWTRTTRLSLSHHPVSGRIHIQRAEQSGPTGPYHGPRAVCPSNTRRLKWALGKPRVTVALRAPCWAPGVSLFLMVD